MKEPCSSYENGVISVDYTKANVNAELDDAFFAVCDFTVDGQAKTVTLTRPFAQVNIGTNDLNAPTVQKIINNIKSELTVSAGCVYTSFDLIKNEVGSATTADVAFAPKDAPSVNEDFPVAGYSNLLSTYLLVPTEQSLANAKYVMNNGSTLIRELSLANTPVRMNYRTNIYGALLTTDQPFNVVIEPAFETPDNEIILQSVAWADFTSANNVDLGVNTTQEDIVLDGKTGTAVSNWADAWFNKNITIKNMTFTKGLSLTINQALANGEGKVIIENCTFYPCESEELFRLGESVNPRIDNAGDGLCLNIDTKNSPNLEIEIRNCKFVGENDITLPRKNAKNWDSYKRILAGTANSGDLKARGHAIAINAIAGAGTAKSVNIHDCTMTGIRGNAIQLYAFAYPITVKNVTIESWGRNNQTANGLDNDSAFRGEVLNGGSLTLENITFGMDETDYLYHVNVNNYAGNTDHTRKAGTY